MHIATTPGAILRAARNAEGLTQADAAARIGGRRHALWGNRETHCTPDTASRMLTDLYGVPWLCVAGRGWAVAMPEADIRAILTTTGD